jgi:large subunit ribosomal protein L4
MTIKVYNQTGQEVGTVDLKPELFEIEPNEAVVHQYVVNYLARQRQGTAGSKGRSEVSGGGRKPYRQKGTGRARSGTSRSPIRRGGGIVFGPQQRKYGSPMPKKMKRIALQSVFADKAQSEKIRIIDDLQLAEIKTKSVTGLLGNLEIDGKKCLILDEGRNNNLVLSCRNLTRVKYCHAAKANGYDILNAEYLILSKAGLEKVQEVFG